MPQCSNRTDRPYITREPGASFIERVNGRRPEWISAGAVWHPVWIGVRLLSPCIEGKKPGS